MYTWWNVDKMPHHLLRGVPAGDEEQPAAGGPGRGQGLLRHLPVHQEEVNEPIPSISIDHKQAFDHFKGFFEILGRGNRKSGSVEI
jgi:hypothetical protein